ncbi:N-acetylneuraminate synthase [Candidatus Marinimicrobia bacterium MT.SAG.3]|nr:N-acetylneuraminate synthase [Candidatus Marinimicrobia bacterium MT.SAG.3]
MSTFIVADIGINHNGNLNIVKELIDVAVFAKCDAVKFQKRTITDVYSPEELDVPRESPFGSTNREQKEGLELGKEEYDEIDKYCKEKGIEWYASSWDIKSQEFLRQYDLKYNKVASAMLTIKPLLTEIAEEKKYTFISTGMSTMDEIGEAVDLFRKFDCPFELMHCNSTYPMRNEDANLKIIQVLKDKFDCKVGYSGHERGLQISLAAVMLGANSIERHITIDHMMYGSDQPASLEPQGIVRLVRDIRIIENAIGDGEKVITEGEKIGRKKLANPYWYKSING